MKTIVTICLLAMTTTCMAKSLPGAVKEDTIVLEFGTKGRVILIGDDKEDFKTMTEYDLNKMVLEISDGLDEADSTEQKVTIEDKEGTKYLKDSTTQLNDFEKLKEEIKKEWQEAKKEKEENKKSSARGKSALEIDLGMNNWLEDGGFPDSYSSDYTVKPWGSWYLAIGGNRREHLWGPMVLNYGGNISWYGWKLENRDVRIQKGADQIEFVEQSNIAGLKSKLSATYININMVPMVDFNYGKGKPGSSSYETFTKKDRKHFRAGIGGYAGYRVGAQTKFIYKEEGDKKKDKIKSDYYLNNLRYGIRGQIGISELDLFFNYDLNEVFNNERGPQLHAFSFGVVF